MKERFKKVLTFNGLFILIGVLGGIASILTLFNTDYDIDLNIKWLIFTVYLFISAVFVLMKIIYDIQKELEQRELKPQFRIIKYQQSTDEFLIGKSSLLGHNALVSIFYSQDDFETEIGKAYVSNITDNYIQLKIMTILDDLSQEIVAVIDKIKSNDAKELKNVTIKSFVTRS